MVSEQEQELPEMTADELKAEEPAVIDEQEEALSAADTLDEEPDGGDGDDEIDNEIDIDEDEDDDPDDLPDDETLEKTAEGA